MELNVARTLSFPELDIELKGDDGQDFTDQSEFPEKCDRPETPESDASTSGVCSLASSDFESSEENLEEKPKTQEEECISCPVIIYQKRDILDVFGNIYPYSVFQTTSVPKMNMSNYWERRSIYHRLGPYGDLDEIDGQKCLLCDFYAAVPKRK
ncbi:hypothetical protein RUM43_009136 [Polyplax serrata]|uniref:Uncharacterized protein n=1 Tax=Polyplax serrata TaxID=468196 RepID=A0AAN8RU72_POLSC